MLLGNLEGVEEMPDGLQSCEDGVLSCEGILPEEDFESSMVFMLAVLEVGIGACELVKVIEEDVDLALELVLHYFYIQLFLVFL